MADCVLGPGVQRLEAGRGWLPVLPPWGGSLLAVHAPTHHRRHPYPPPGLSHAAGERQVPWVGTGWGGGSLLQ